MAQDIETADFNAVYGPLLKDVFRGIAHDELAQGVEPERRARDYAARGKPDFALAYLLVSPLADDEKREVLAQSYDERARHTEEKAREFDRRFHRSFAMLFTEASKDRATAKQIRAGHAVRKGAGRQLPMA